MLVVDPKKRIEWKKLLSFIKEDENTNNKINLYDISINNNNYENNNKNNNNINSNNNIISMNNNNIHNNNIILGNNNNLNKDAN